MSGGWLAKLGSDAGLRARSAAVLVLIAAPALLIGGWSAALLAAVAAGLMGWEWRLISLGRAEAESPMSAPLILGLAFGALLTHFLGLGWGLAALALGAGLNAVWERSRKIDWRWGLLGAVWIGLGVLSFVWLRGDSTQGLKTVLWLLLVVAATDVGAWASGRAIGGPKLAPRISPKKTWAGLIGAVVAAGAAGLLAGLALGGSASLGLLGACLAAIAQAGDLAESALKRHFGVKDASNLIPGHGGVMDRTDGLMAASFALALMAAAGWSLF